MENLSKGQFQISKFVLYFEAQAEGRGLLGDIKVLPRSFFLNSLVQIMIRCNTISLF